MIKSIFPPASYHLNINNSEDNALQQLLSCSDIRPQMSNWIILRNYPVTNINSKAEDGKDGEIDLIVIAPGFGIFAIETKGDSVLSIYDKNLVAKYEGQKKTKNVKEQSVRNFHLFIDALNLKLNKKLEEIEMTKINDLISDNLLCVPNNNSFFKPLNDSSMDGEHLILKMDDFYTKIAYICELDEKKGKQRLSLEEANFIADFLLHTFEFSNVSKTKVAINSTQEQLNEFFQVNRASIESIIFNNKRVRINGEAGSGKTSFARELFERQCLQGKRTLFLVYNKDLCSFLKDASIKKNIKNGEIYCYWDFVKKIYYDYCTNNHISPQIEIIDTADNDETINIKEGKNVKILSSFLESKQFLKTELNKYDCLIIDEAQDINCTDDAYELLNFILKDGVVNGEWALFYDPLQDVMNRSLNIKVYDVFGKDNIYSTVYGLPTNIRCSTPIYNIMKDINKNPDENFLIDPLIDFFPYNNDFTSLNVIKDKNEDDLKMIINQLDKLINDKFVDKKITILFDAVLLKKGRNYIINKLKEHYGDILQRYGKGDDNTITFETVRKYKGLENLAIIYIKDKSNKNIKDINVAISRARIFLHVFEVEPEKTPSKFILVNDSPFEGRTICYNVLSDENCIDIPSAFNLIEEAYADCSGKGAEKVFKIYNDNYLNQPVYSDDDRLLEWNIAGSKGDLYIVRLFLDEDNRLCLNCSCPFDNDNSLIECRPCKHEIALLFYIYFEMVNDKV